MWLSVAFPTCPSCRNNSNKCYHKTCPQGGKIPMEINPDTAHVRCPSCGKSWHIKESNYYCNTCNYRFSAEDVRIEIDAIVANAKLIAQEMKRIANTRERINTMTYHDIENIAKSTIKKTFGEKLWEIIKKSIPAIVETIKAWLGIA